MSLKYRIALTVFLLEAAMIAFVVWQLDSLSSHPQLPRLMTSSEAAGRSDAHTAEVLQQTLQMARDRVLFIAVVGMSLIALSGISIGILFTRRHKRLADQTGATMVALESSEARHRALVEYCPAAIFVFDPEAFRLVDVNQKWVDLLKYPRERIVGMTPLDASPPLQKGGRSTDDWAKELVQRTFAGENPIAPWILRDSTGRDFTCELQLARYPEAGKNLIIGIIYDVSDRDRLAQALERRVRFEDLIVRLSARLIGLKLDDIDAGLQEALGEIGVFAGVDRSYVFEFSPDQKTESCTHEWCASGIEPAIHRLQNLPLGNYPWFMARIGKGEVLHVPRVSELPPEAAAERTEFEAENIQSVIMVPLVFEGEVSGYMGFDAVHRPVEWPPEIVLLLRIAGEIVFNAVHRKRNETAILEHTQALKQANDALARSNEELKQFAYVASHDLREPLRAIAGFSALLAQKYSGRLDQDADEYIRFMTDAASRMHAMINDLLSYSRLDTQAEPYRACDMNQMLALAQANLLAAISEHHAQITHGILPVVQADATQVIQLLQNLIGNAIKFHGDESPTVHVDAERRGNEWLFSVNDNGIGINPLHTETVFQIFKRLHTTDKYPGTGIGLAVCKRIAERHGGHIWVERNAERGSTFYFTLPAIV